MPVGAGHFQRVLPLVSESARKSSLVWIFTAVEYRSVRYAVRECLALVVCESPVAPSSGPRPLSRVSLVNLLWPPRRATSVSMRPALWKRWMWFNPSSCHRTVTRLAYRRLELQCQILADRDTPVLVLMNAERTLPGHCCRFQQANISLAPACAEPAVICGGRKLCWRTPACDGEDQPIFEQY